MLSIYVLVYKQISLKNFKIVSHAYILVYKLFLFVVNFKIVSPLPLVNIR